MAFRNTWKVIQIELKPSEVDKWSQKKKFLGGSVRVTAVESDCIRFEIRPGEEEVVTAADFEHMYSHWADYRAEKIGRAKIKDEGNFKLSYIIPVLYWLEQKLGKLP